MLRRYFISPQVFLWFTFASYLLIWRFGVFDIEQIRSDTLVIGCFTFVLSSIFLSRRLAPVTLEPRDTVKLLLGCSIAMLLLVVYAVTIVGFSVASLADARFAIPGYGAVFALYFTASLIGFALLGQHRGRAGKYLFILAALFSGIVFGGKAFIVPWIWGLIFGWHLFGIRLKRSTILTYGVLAAAGVVFVVAGVSQNPQQAVAAIGLRLFLQADALNWLSQMSLGDIHAFPVSAAAFFTDIFSRLAGVRLVERAIGSEMAYLVAGDDSGGGPNPYLPVLSYLLAKGSLLYAIWLAACVIAVLAVLSAFCNATLFRRGTIAVAARAISFVVPFAVIDLILLFQYIFCIAFLILIGQAVGALLMARPSRASPLGATPLPN